MGEGWAGQREVTGGHISREAEAVVSQRCRHQREECAEEEE